MPLVQNCGLEKTLSSWLRLAQFWKWLNFRQQLNHMTSAMWVCFIQIVLKWLLNLIRAKYDNDVSGLDIRRDILRQLFEKNKNKKAPVMRLRWLNRNVIRNRIFESAIEKTRVLRMIYGAVFKFQASAKSI